MTRMLRHILVLLTVCAQAAGCTILPELHLRQPMEAQIMLETQVNVSVMWQVDWQAQWQFPELRTVHIVCFVEYLLAVGHGQA